MREAITAEKAMVRETGEERGMHGGSKAADRERKRRMEKTQLIRIIFKRKREQREKNCEERERERRLRGLVE